MKVLALGLITMTLATGCGKSNSSSWSGGDTLQMKAERQAKLQGTYRDECSKVEGGKGSYHNTTTFTADGKMASVSQLFKGSDCTGEIERTDASAPCKYSETELNEDLKGTMVVDCPADEFGPATSTKASVQIEGKKLTLKALSVERNENGKLISATAEELAQDGESVMTKIEKSEAQSE